MERLWENLAPGEDAEMPMLWNSKFAECSSENPSHSGFVGSEVDLGGLKYLSPFTIPFLLFEVIHCKILNNGIDDPVVENTDWAI